MRRSLIALSLPVGALAIAAIACSDERQPTSPAEPGPSRIAASSPTAAVSTSAKPQPAPTGFTAVVEVASETVPVPAGGGATPSVPCPAGSVVTGGGYWFTNLGSINTPPFVQKSKAAGASWTVTVWNKLSAVDASIIVYAYCAS